MRYLHYALVLALLSLPAFAQDETMKPDTTNASNDGTTCDSVVHSVIDDDPDSPGNDWCVADDDASTWDFMVTMENPTDTLDATTDAQVIDFYVRNFDENADNDPTIRIEIYDTTTVACDTLHQTLGTTTLTDAGFPAKITETWTAAGISGSADICVKVICTKAAGGPGARNSCDIDALEWDVTHAAGGGRTRRSF